MRTVYRDIAALIGQGVPIGGEAGVLLHACGLRPAAADVQPPGGAGPGGGAAGGRVAPRRGPGRAGRERAVQVLAVLPIDARAAAESLAVYAPSVALDPNTSHHLTVLREATESRHKLRVQYLDLGGARSERVGAAAGLPVLGAGLDRGRLVQRAARGLPQLRVDRIENLQQLKTASATSRARPCRMRRATDCE